MQEDETVPEIEVEDEGSIWFQMSDRHPNFDEYWERHQRLVYQQAYRIAAIFNAGDYRNRWRYSYADFLGVLVFRLNYCLHHYTEDKGAFSTYFHVRIVHFCVKFCLRYESEYWATKSFSRDKSYEVGVEAQNNREFYESEYFLYRVPDGDHDWAMDIIDLFETPRHLWEYLAKGVPERSANIVLWYYRDGKTLRQIAEMIDITFERVRQILARTMQSLRRRIQRLDAFRKLFNDYPEMLSYDDSGGQREAGGRAE